MDLIIVESPTKARTFTRILGDDFSIEASMGHVRDLPEKKMSIDLEHTFKPEYVILPSKQATVDKIAKIAKKAKTIILATDSDREGEAIAYHIAFILGHVKEDWPNKPHIKNSDLKRIVFHEITESAIRQALQSPRQLNVDLVDAQQGRRLLDRIVGYKLSPLLWKKMGKRWLSAGRVQSVAVRLVVEKEEEIKKFVAQEYWQIIATLKKQDTRNNNQTFEAFLNKKNGKTVDKLEIKNEQESKEILKDLENAEYKIEKVDKKETKKNPLPPFTTSTLQQSAANKFGYSSKYTMSLAQKLYEQGHITYHRTDSLNLSQMSLDAAEKFITSSFGKNYFNQRRFKAKGNAQEAHEAVRPTFAEKSPESLKGELESAQLKLYTLIWQRFIASQMTSAIFDSTKVEITANNYGFGANGQILKFDGFLKVYPMKFSENEMPELKEKEVVELININPSQHFTEPPARYNEASLIKALELHGIGRPSTYAPTLSTIQDRHYIEKNDQKRFFPTEMGVIVNDVLVKNFPEIVDINFTASMEKELDEIAEGKDTWQKTVKDFYEPFAKNLKEKYEDVPKENLDIKTDKKCPKCGKDMVEKMGRFGRFFACTGFPECKHTESVITGASPQAIKIDITCPKCKTGQVVAKKTRKGKIFYGCDNYPKCDFAAWDKPINEFCPKCNSILVQTKSGKVKCSSKECDYKKD